MDVTDNQTDLQLNQTVDLIKSMDSGEIIFNKYRVVKLKEIRDGLLYYKSLDLSNKNYVVIETPESLNELVWNQCLDFYKSEVLDHKNIMKPVEIIIHETGHPVFVKNYNNKVSIEEVVSTTGPIEQEKQIVYLVKQICSGLKKAHANAVLHGDLRVSDIFLGSSSDAGVIAQIDNFQLASSDLSIGIKQDVFALAVVSYFVACGVNISSDFQLPTREVVENLDIIFKVRPDLVCLDEFVQLIEDATCSNIENRIDSIDEFEDGLLDWLAAVEAVAKAPAQKSISDIKKTANQSEIETPTTKDLSSVVKHMTELRVKQANQEESMIIKLTDLASSGARKSPAMTAIRVSIISVVWALLVGAIAIVYIFNPNLIESAWVTTSKGIYNTIKPNDSDNQIEEETVKSLGKPIVVNNFKPSGAKQIILSNDNRGRSNKLPKFDPAILRSIYQRKSGMTNNTKGKLPAFRIEYREFNEDWIK